MMRKAVFWIGLFVVLGWSSGASSVPIQWTIAEGGNGHYYEPINTSVQTSWQDAKNFAEVAGGYLATVTSQDENDWIVSNILPLVVGSPGSLHMGPWIGGYQNTTSPSYSEPDGGWTWVTGESWSYTNWSAREPNDGPTPIYNYLHYYLPGVLGDADGWNDEAAYLASVPVYSYIVETVPEPSTALLLGIGLSALAATRRKRSCSGDTDRSFSPEKETPTRHQPLPASSSPF